jgi:hypothetical protein
MYNLRIYKRNAGSRHVEVLSRFFDTKAAALAYASAEEHAPLTIIDLWVNGVYVEHLRVP